MYDIKEKCKNSIYSKLKLLMVFFTFMFGLSIYANAKPIYAGQTYLIKNGNEQEAKKVHKKLIKGKSVKLKFRGNVDAVTKKVVKLEKSISKVNKYAVSFSVSEKDMKYKKKTLYVKVNKECATQYKELVLLLKKMKKFYLNKNVKTLKKKLKFNYYAFDKYVFKKTEDKTATPEPGIYEEGDKYEMYTLNYGDDNSLLSITYFPEKNYYDLADYGNYTSDFEKGEYLETLKDINKYYYTAGSNAKHYKVDASYMDKIKSEITLANKKTDAEIEKAKKGIENLSEDSIKYLKDSKYMNEYIACSKIKNNDFCDVSDALKIYMISRCFVYDDGKKANHNPFIQYDEMSSGSSGGIVYHYDNNPSKHYLRDYRYEGNDKFFSLQKKGKVSSVLKKLRTGKFKGVCHDYSTAAGYIYYLLNIDCYYGYSKKANHAVAIVKAKNSEGKTFWVYQNYSMLGGANDKVNIVGLCLKGKKYEALGSSKKVQKQIRKSKFSMSDFN